MDGYNKTHATVVENVHKMQYQNMLKIIAYNTPTGIS